MEQNEAIYLMILFKKTPGVGQVLHYSSNSHINIVMKTGKFQFLFRKLMLMILPNAELYLIDYHIYDLV